MSDTAPYTGNPPKRPWLLMLYMSADAANLQAPLVTELEELLRPIREMGGASQNTVYVIAQIETPGGVIKRLDLSTGEPKWLEKASNADLLEFVLFARQHFPADYRAIVFWGHSAGVGATLTMQGVGLPGGCSDRSTEVTEPAQPRYPIPPENQKIDIVAFDSCYLASLEIAWELHPYANWLLASENSISLTGWQFDVMVTAILARPTIEPKELAQSLVDAVSITRLSPSTLALYDLTQIATVGPAFKVLTECLTNALDGNVKTWPGVKQFEARLWILHVFHHAISTKVRQFIDLPDLCRRLAAEGPGRDVRRAAWTLLNSLKEFIVDSVDSTGTGLGGVSIYCPWPRATEGEVRRGARNVEMDPNRYENFLLSTETKWVALLKRLEMVQDADQRAARRQAREYSLQGRSWPGGPAPSAWEAKPIEMGMKPIEMAMKPIEMEMKPIEMELKPIEMEIFPRF